MYYVYILQCADKTYYVGSTNDLEKRLHSHNHLKSGAHYTKIRRPVKLVYTEKYKTYSAVRAREGELKLLKRSEKAELIQMRRSIPQKTRISREYMSGAIPLVGTAPLASLSGCLRKRSPHKTKLRTYKK